MTTVELCNLALSLIGGKPIGALNDATRQAEVCNKWFAAARDEALAAHPWNFARDRARLTKAWVVLSGTAITNSGGLIKVTKTGHGLTTGLRVLLDGVGGLSGANASWIITRVDADNFTLDDSVFSGSYTSDTGRYVQQPLFGWNYQYTLPSNCLRVLRVNGDDSNENDTEPYNVEGKKLLTDAEGVNLQYIFQETATANWPADFCNAFAVLLASYLATDLVGTGTGRASALRAQFTNAILPSIQTDDAREGRSKTREPGADSRVIAARKGWRYS